MKKIIIVLGIISFLFQTKINAQCDSVFITNIEIPQDTSSNIIVSINNISGAQHIYLNLILTDKLTGQVIAESLCGNLILYPNQINVYEIDTSAVFCDWQLYYNWINIPEISDISVNLNYLCDSIQWESSLSITESHTNNSFVIYPNPATSKLIIKGKQNINFTVLNSFGKIIINSKTESGEINIQYLPKGVYFLKLEDVPVTHRFIKE